MVEQSVTFDVIDHDILLQRLEFAFGISGRALKWFGSYLQDRSQCVCVGKDVSKTPSCGLYSTPRLSTGSAPCHLLNILTALLNPVTSTLEILDESDSFSPKKPVRCLLLHW